jgi:hypothetical protein
VFIRLHPSCSYYRWPPASPAANTPSFFSFLRFNPRAPQGRDQERVAADLLSLYISCTQKRDRIFYFDTDGNLKVASWYHSLSSAEW